MLKGQIITVREKSYEVKFPNVGQFIEIESMKISFTKGRYVNMALSDLQAHRFTLDMADAVSYLSVLIPELKDDLKIKGWWEMETSTAKELIAIYHKQFIPWFKPILNDLYSYEEEIEEDESTKKQ